MIIQYDRWTSESHDQIPINTVFYTTFVINTPSRVEFDIRSAHERLMGMALRPIRREATEVLMVRITVDPRQSQWRRLTREVRRPCPSPT
jgi:hypothetical protein